MKRLITCLIVLLVAILALAACARDEEPAPGAAATPAPAAPGQPTPAPAVVDPAPAGPPTMADGIDEFMDFHFPARDLGGVTLIWSRIGDPYSENPAIAARDQERRERVESRFNISLEFIPRPYELVDWDMVDDHLIATHVAGDPFAHIIEIYMGHWFLPMVQAGTLYEMGDVISQNFPPHFYRDFAQFHGRNYGFGTNPFQAWNHLMYNRTLIQATGIDMTPSEMFVAGRWSHDDFFDYLQRLQPLLPPDVFAFSAHNVIFYRKFASAAGGGLMDSSTFIPTFLETPFLASTNLHQRILAAGVHPPANYNPDTGNWGFVQASFNEGLAAMEIIGCGGGLINASALFEVGYVPPPWSNDMTFPASGDWRDLKSTNPGYRSWMDDQWIIVSVEPNALPGDVNAQDIINMIFTFYEDRAEFLVYAREMYAQGILAAPPRMRGSDYFWTDLDRELYHWYSINPRLHAGNVAGPGGIRGAFEPTYRNVVAGGGDPHASFSPLMGRIVWQLYDTGIVLREDIPAAIWIQAQEFGATLEEEEEE